MDGNLVSFKSVIIKFYNYEFIHESEFFFLLLNVKQQYLGQCLDSK